MTEIQLAKSRLRELKLRRMDGEVALANAVQKHRDSTSAYTRRKIRDINWELLNEYNDEMQRLAVLLGLIDDDIAELEERIG